MFNKKNKPQPKRLQQPEVSPINVVKINALSQMYANLPKSGFSKLVVTFCLCFSLLAIVASFVFLWFGMDASSLLVPALGFFGSELLVLGATNIFNKEKTKDDLIFEQLRHDLNDGYYYNSETGKAVFKENAEIQSQDYQNTDDVENIIKDTAENIKLDPMFSVDTVKSIQIPQVETQKTPIKKRGRPKKVTQTSQTKQDSKQDSIQEQEETKNQADWFDEDMSD